MLTLFYIAAIACTLWMLLNVWAVVRTRRGRAAHNASQQPAISVLKPLCGVDDDLEGNLRSFFEQDYPDFELVFGVQGEADPAADIVRKLRDEYPHVECRLVVHDGGRGINPKVSNIRATLPAASHDLVVISDSNIHAPVFYLSEMAEAMSEEGVGLVSNLFVSEGGYTIGAQLEALHLTGVVAGAIATPTQVGMAAVMGKSMMFRRSVFERLGGFESVANVLAEDYVIGRMFGEAGFKIRLAKTPLLNVARNTTIKQYYRRHLRWGMMRARMVPLVHALELITIPMVFVLLAPLVGASIKAMMVWAVAVTLIRDASLWVVLNRSAKGLLQSLVFFPLRDSLVLTAWVMAPFQKHVVWRGNRVRVSAGTRLYAEQETAESELLIVEA